RSRLWRDGDRLLAARPEDRDDRFGEVVEPERRGADAVPHLVEPGENAIDLRVIAQRDRHEADAIREWPGLLGELQDPVGGKRTDRQVVVPGPAEPAQVRAAADHFDEEPRS